MSPAIAVVDTNEAIRDAIEMVLASHGWHICTYATGEAFLADLNHHALDCVILDPHLTGISGAEVTRSVMNADADIPIIGLTARPNSPVSTEVINAGARVMLMKPNTAKELADQVEAAIRA